MSLGKRAREDNASQRNNGNRKVSHVTSRGGSIAVGCGRAPQISDIDSPCRFSVWRGRRLATGALFLLRLFVNYLRAVNHLSSVEIRIPSFLTAPPKVW